MGMGGGILMYRHLLEINKHLLTELEAADYLYERRSSWAAHLAKKNNELKANLEYEQYLYKEEKEYNVELTELLKRCRSYITEDEELSREVIRVIEALEV